MEVGIEECLHIEFEFNQSKFHLKDCILGKVFFNLVRIKIKHMELSIIRKEIVGSGANAVTETENLNKFEIIKNLSMFSFKFNDNYFNFCLISKVKTPLKFCSNEKN